jgi:ERCC4-type nuclease
MIQRILKPEGKIYIIVDFREENCSVTDHLREMEASVKPLPLKVGDYVCSERVCVERKAGEDFISSIIDGRIFKQAQELKDNFSKPVFLIEGNYLQERMNENAVKSALASIILDYEIPIVMTKTEEESARLIFWLAKREQLISKKGMGIKGVKKPKGIKDLQEYVISSLPGVSNVLSKRILKDFKTIKNFANASESEISKVKGIGKVLAKRLHRMINEEWRE